MREDRLGSILLTVDEGNAIMGSTDMQDFGGPTTLDTNLFQVSNPDCLGAAHIVQPPVYADSGYTAVKFDVLREQGQRYTHSIEQAVTTFPAADQATVVVGTVIDPEMSNELRVTVVATGLGAVPARAQTHAANSADCVSTFV